MSDSIGHSFDHPDPVSALQARVAEITAQLERLDNWSFERVLPKITELSKAANKLTEHLVENEAKIAQVERQFKDTTEILAKRIEKLTAQVSQLAAKPSS